MASIALDRRLHRTSVIRNGKPRVTGLETNAKRADWMGHDLKEMRHHHLLSVSKQEDQHGHEHDLMHAIRVNSFCAPRPRLCPAGPCHKLSGQL